MVPLLRFFTEMDSAPPLVAPPDTLWISSISWIPLETLKKPSMDVEWLLRFTSHLRCCFIFTQGVWTLESRGEDLPEEEAHSTSFETAVPTFTHLALAELHRAGKLKYLISQNVDGLHIRSGFPETAIAELHGNLFMERCPGCGATYMRDSDVGGVGLKETGNRCPQCNRHLVDTVLDWDSELPQDHLKTARRHSREADLVLCLGTSLRIEPVCGLPFLRMGEGKKKVAICNLQKTPMDKRANIVVRGDVDRIMHIIMERLGLAVPAFDPPIGLCLSHTIAPHPPDSLSRLELLVTSDGLG